VVVVTDRPVVDLSQLATLRALVESGQPQLIANADPFSAAGKARNDAAIAKRANTDAIGRPAREAKSLGAWFTQYSRGYVSLGNGENAPGKLAETGSLLLCVGAKIGGQDAIRGGACWQLIIRTSWVHSVRGGHVIYSMFGRGRGLHLMVTSDIVGRLLISPSSFR